MRKQIMKKLNEKISERPRAQALIKKGILCPPAPPLNECLQSLKSSRRTDEMVEFVFIRHYKIYGYIV